MAPQNVVIVNAVNPDAALARKAAKSLKLPDRTPKELVEDLLTRLSNVKRRRELRRLNHWEEFAPSYLERLVIRHERLRVSAIEAFYRTEKSKALAYAQLTLGDRTEAEDAVGEALLKLLAGKSGPGHFYRILRLVCVDKLRARYSAGKLFKRRRDHSENDKDSFSFEPACNEIGGGDPLELLIHQEDIREGIRAIQTDSEYRDVRRLGWWKELTSHYVIEGV